MQSAASPKTRRLYLSGCVHNNEIDNCEDIGEIWFNKKSVLHSVDDVALRLNGVDPHNCQIQDIAFVNSANIDQSINNANEKGQHFSIIKYAREILFGNVYALDQFIHYAIDRDYVLGQHWKYEEIDENATIVLYNLDSLVTCSTSRDIDVLNKLQQKFRRVKFYITEEKYFNLVLKLYTQNPSVTLKFQRLDLYIQSHLDFVVKNIENLQVYILNLEIRDLRVDAGEVMKVLQDNDVLTLWYKTIKDQKTASKMLNYYNVSSLKLLIDSISADTIYQIVQHNGMNSAITLICNENNKYNLQKLLEYPRDKTGYIKKVKITFDGVMDNEITQKLKDIFSDKLVIETNQYIYEQLQENNFQAWSQLKEQKNIIKSLQSENESLKKENEDQSRKLEQYGSRISHLFDGKAQPVRLASTEIIKNKPVKIKFEDGEIDEKIVADIRQQYGNKVKISKQNQIDNLCQQIEALKTECAAIRAQLSTVGKCRCDEQKGLIEYLREQLAEERRENMSEVGKLVSQVEQLTATVQKIEEECNTGQKNNDDLRSQVSLLCESLDTLRVERLAQTDELRAIKGSIGVVRQEIEELQRATSQQSKQLSSYKNCIQAVQNLTLSVDQVK